MNKKLPKPPATTQTAGAKIRTPIDVLKDDLGRPGHQMAGLTFLPHLPKVVCQDGFSMSVQASETHYCSPRDNIGPWDEVEVGYPSARPEPFEPTYVVGLTQAVGWTQFMERWPEDVDPTQAVYGYVPLALVEYTIRLHGGLDEEATGHIPTAEAAGSNPENLNTD
jgi:hypothetical protein